MEPKQYKAGRSTNLMYVGIIVFWLLFAAAGAVWTKMMFWYIVPAFFILINVFKLYMKLTQPIPEISDDKLIILSSFTPIPHESVPLNKITAIRSEGDKKIELIYQNEIPREVFIGELSEEDRKDFTVEIARRTGAKVV